MLEAHGIHFMGMGISGGEVGARNGPSLMPGGTIQAWDAVKDVLEAMTAKAVRWVPCIRHPWVVRESFRSQRIGVVCPK
jgi:6-phosphogluconate dehydrogenase